MRRSWILLTGALMLSGVARAEAPPRPAAAAPAAQPGLATAKDQASYAIGLSIGQEIQSGGAEINVDALVMGVRDALTSAKPKMTKEQIVNALKIVREEMSRKFEDRRKESAEKNKTEAKAFLVENAKKPGVVTLPSGLQYSVIKQGTGPTPKLTDTVQAHYHGTLIDGTVFDSSVERGEPADFPVGGVIRGWTEALQKMKVGDKWKLFIPAELAYGPAGAGDIIGPNATLIFEVELLAIKSESAPAAPAAPKR